MWHPHEAPLELIPGGAMGFGEPWGFWIQNHNTRNVRNPNKTYTDTDWWLMIDDWWLMIHDSWLIIFDYHAMCSVGKCIVVLHETELFKKMRSRLIFIKGMAYCRIGTPSRRSLLDRSLRQHGCHLQPWGMCHGQYLANILKWLKSAQCFTTTPWVSCGMPPCSSCSWCSWSCLGRTKATTFRTWRMSPIYPQIMGHKMT